MKKGRILVWLSGWVDSAVAAALLLEQGYEVVGGFMKNYVSETGNCTTYNDAEEAIKVAKHLGIELLPFDLQKEYQERIIDYIFEGYQRGITPNPDVLCNSLIKFDVFLQRALELWFDKIATGHYARITPLLKGGKERSDGGFEYHEEQGISQRTSPTPPSEGGDQYALLRWIDHTKDQSYFLAGLNQFQLSKILFPLGEYRKSKVRDLAKKFWLPNAERKDSQGLCFIGNVPIRDFLLQRFEKKEGDIVYTPFHEGGGSAATGDFQESTIQTQIPPSPLYERGQQKGVVWTHQWAYFYTIGQKHGLGLNFKAYVYRIDIENNILYVTDKDSEQLKAKTLIAKDWHWIGGSTRVKNQQQHTNPPGGSAATGKIRYRQNPPVPCTLEEKADWIMQVTFETEQRAVAPGQIFVAYDGEVCLWCGVIA